MADEKIYSELGKLLLSMVCSIVDETEKVELEASDTPKGYLFQIAVSKGDVAKLIGRKGRVATAIRSVMKAAGAKRGVKILVNVLNVPLADE
jgi:predicted RNA-binding protein YlqC (UPF0109 family)